MGKVSTSQMAIVSDSRRLSSLIPITAISMDDKTNEIIVTGPRSNLFSSRKILDSRDYRSLPDPKRDLSVQLLYDPGTNEEKTNFRLFPTQPLLTISTLQDGRCSSSKADHRERRPDVQTGSQGYICSSANTPSIPTIFNLQTPESESKQFINENNSNKISERDYAYQLWIPILTKLFFINDMVRIKIGETVLAGTTIAKSLLYEDSNHVVGFKVNVRILIDYKDEEFDLMCGEACHHDAKDTKSGTDVSKLIREGKEIQRNLAHIFYDENIVVRHILPYQLLTVVEQRLIITNIE
ncbi:hypothetical protein G6F57_002861 [Rhizopus arrhizus]|nr:hypothetical protein G6F30_000927 [Rhizopus arrhizus]KAG1427361.1 hypothetical protein G6F58_001060 [Rhizopus delemar]KAG0989285.1 hypothetical protein G6F29_001122 [Rhizopus arrhizus]KAG1000057.1 hypothetical protein G6F28_000435 [Rhizopus arrhizus]KAG1014356.1 hypothetical protein G6F27_001062 [Rhizopus arrhizus]